MHAGDRPDHARDPPAGADDHLAVDLLAQDPVRGADVVLALGRDRRRLEPEAGLAHGARGLVDDLVAGLAPLARARGRSARARARRRAASGSSTRTACSSSSWPVSSPSRTMIFSVSAMADAA